MLDPRGAGSEVLRALDGGDDVEAEQAVVALLERAVLREELDRPVARAVDADLRPSHDAEAVLESDLGTVVETEEIREQVAEVTLTERTRKAMGQAEYALVTRHDAAWSAD